mgnify:CR=1 FL=1
MLKMNWKRAIGIASAGFGAAFAVTSIVTGKFQLIEDSSFCLGCIGLV